MLADAHISSLGYLCWETGVELAWKTVRIPVFFQPGREGGAGDNGGEFAFRNRLG